MSTLLLGSQFNGEAPQDDGDVRSTITVIDNESPTPEATRAPEFNQVDTDPDTEGGLTTRAVSDLVTSRERRTPDTGNANTDFAAPVNNQVSTSGTAAQRESSGEWGHGSMQYTNSIEPAIREGGQFENVYFAAKRPAIQEGTKDYLEAPRVPDSKSAVDSKAASAAAARAAASRAMYQRFLDERTGR